MKIGIDLSPVENNPAGIGQYTISLISRLVELDGEDEFITYTTQPLFLPRTNNVVIRFPGFLPFKGIRWMLKVAHHAKSQKVDLFISPSNHLFSILLKNNLQMVHDLAPVKFPQFFSKKAALSYKFSTKIALQKAKAVITISETVKQELIAFTKIKNKEKILVVYPALNPWIVSGQGNFETIPYNLPEKYILSLGTLEPRKNFENLIRGFKIFSGKSGNKLSLVIVGKKGWFYEEIFKTVKEQKLEEKVIFLGYVPNEHLAAIYKMAAGFAYLSYYEGFGIPPLESLYFNLPTLVSNIPVFHETFSDMVSYTDPREPEAIATDLEQLLKQKPQPTRELVANRYSWEKSVKKLIEVIHNLHEKTDQ